jgi:hypothetical protein
MDGKAKKRALEDILTMSVRGDDSSWLDMLPASWIL